MDITPLIPDGYNGPIKRLTCSICKHMFYITQDDYHRLPEVRFCHECSLILREELEKTQGASPLTPPPVRAKPVAHSPVLSSVAPLQPILLPQPRTIDREKMTVEQLLEEAEMLCKTWRYKGALHSCEEALQRDPHCLKALYSRASILSILDRSKEALPVYEELLSLEPGSVKAYSRKGEILIGLRRYDEALAALDTALQIDPSYREASTGKWLLLTHLHRDEEAERFFPPKTENRVYQQELTQPCHTAEDYSRRGDILRALGRDEEAIGAYEESLRLDPLHQDWSATRRRSAPTLLQRGLCGCAASPARVFSFPALDRASGVPLPNRERASRRGALPLYTLAQKRRGWRQKGGAESQQSN
jgi:tetratricopeptide (TPR) repeat protein